MKKSTIVFFLLGLVGLVVMFFETDFSLIDWDGKVWGLLPVWLPVILLIWAVIYAMHVISYRIILGESRKKIRAGFLVKMTLTGFALNDVTPIGLIGGEPYRIMEMKPFIGVEKAISTTLTFSVMHVFTHMLFLFTGAAAYFVIGCPGGTVATVFVGIALVLLGLVVFAFFRSGKHRLVGSFLKFFSRIPKLGRFVTAFIDKNREKIDDIDRSMMEFHTRTKDFWTTAALEYGARLLEASEFYFLLRIFGADVNFVESCIAVACASLLGNLLFLIPMQVGSREFGMAMSLGWAGVPASFGVTASLLARIREMIYLAVGVVLILVKTKHQKNEKGTQ